jgi:hypothetical protein
VPIDPQRPGQSGQGWLVVVGFVGTVAAIVLLAIWAAHHG